MRAQEERPGQAVGRQRPVVTAGPVGPVAAGASSAGWTAEAMAALQSTAGNAAVQRALARERHEHGAGCGHPEAAPVQRSSVADVVSGAGRPLAADVRADMEQRLGADFSDVRLHTDSVAQRSAAEIGARAYTSGSHVVVGAGGADKHTLAHELTHVVQQRSGPVAGTDNGAGLRVSDPSDRFEREAEDTARRVMSGPAPRGGLPDTDAAPATGGGDSGPALPVQRAFSGALHGYTTPQALARLKELFPGSNPGWTKVDAARRSTVDYDSFDALASVACAQPPRSGAATASTVTPAPAPGASTASGRAPASATALEATSDSGATSASATAPGTTTAPGRQRPAVRPKPTTVAGPQSASTAPRRQDPQVPAHAPVSASAPPVGTTAPAAAVEESKKRTGERISPEDFAANSAQARSELEDELLAPRRYLRPNAARRLDEAALEQMAHSVNITNRTKVLPILIDQLYSCLEWTGRAPIAVFTHEAQGKGDLMLGVKTADALRETFPRTGANKNDIALLTAGAAHTRQPGVFEDAAHPFAVLGGSDATPAAPPLARDEAPTHVVVAPQLSATKKFQQSVGGWGSTVSAMTEYSKKESPPPGATGTGHTTGLGPDEVGITFDAGLRHYKQQQDGITGEAEKRAARLENIHALKSAELLTALFPEEQEKTARDFAAAASSRLYFAYSNKSAVRFALTVAEIENGRDNDVHVVQSSPTQGPTELDGTMRRDLAALGVARVRLVTVTAGRPAPAISVQETGGDGKTMHWITADRVPHDDMLTLIKASEPIVMTTGNQSTSEALSAGKTILYESIGMEQSRAFRESLYGGAGVGASDKADIAAVSRDYDDRRSAAPGQPEFKAAAAALGRMQEQDRMGAFSDKASATKDLGRWIGGQHLRDYLMRTPLRAELESEEAKLKSAGRKPEAYGHFVDHLLSLPGEE
ncbi:eCIS core domain-containing protein [Streptomyces griseiscabiei]